MKYPVGSDKKEKRRAIIIFIIGFIFILISTILIVKFSHKIGNWSLLILPYLLIFFTLLIIVDIIRIAFQKNIGYPIKENLIDKRINIFLTMIGVIILFFQTMIFLGQLNVFEKQTKILEESSPPYEPWIQIIPDYKDLIIISRDFVNKQDLNQEPEYAWARIGMTIYNFGKMDSQHIYCDLKIISNPLEGYLKYYDKETKKFSTNNIENIPASNSIEVSLHIRSKDCQKDAIEKCDEKLIPTGEQEIILNCECDGCKKQKYFNETIKFCIWNENKEIECPEI